jgi:D-beta-D-heptose 7-phosphate kinase/D-beta-D-heptose 1-phosphate adenosyltransferase
MMSYYGIIKAMPTVSVMVIGDPMWDIYHHGSATRLSPEAPVPVFKLDYLDQRPGGAANVAAQVEALGADVHRYMPVAPWVEKHRYMVGNHQLFREDKDREYKPHGSPDLSGIDIVILSDYGKGWLTYDLCQMVIAGAEERGIQVVVDPKGSKWNKYRGCDIICPNEVEAMNPDVVNFSAVLYKQGAAGMTLDILGDKKIIKATAKQVYDVTGAGDTVVAVFATALAAGATYVQAAVMANKAAGIVVGRLGTAQVTAEELLAELVETA